MKWDLSNSWLEKSDFKKADLGGADLGNGTLRSANFTNAILDNAIFRYTDLGEANVSGIGLRGPKLKDARF